MDKRIFRIGSILESIKTLKDGSFRLVFESGEMPVEQAANLLAQRQKFGWLLFAPEETTEVLIPKEPPKEFRQERSQCQRLRGVLYREWEQTRPTEEFESFYRMKMERIIESEKEHLS